ncbi:MAG: hypothetical protein ACREC0_05420 [Methylocella sp.]
MSPKLHVTIDRLVLHGFAPGQRDAVVAGFRGELARLLAVDGAGAAFGDSRAVNALKVAPRRAGGAGAGESAARQLLQGLRR